MAVNALISFAVHHHSSRHGGVMKVVVPKVGTV
jgi:hypothetical protein